MMSAMANPILLALLVLLFDPGAVFGRTLAKANFLQSGNFLRLILGTLALCWFVHWKTKDSHRESNGSLQ
jgi:hypothetical protein